MFLLFTICVCSVDSLRAFVQQYVDGELEVYIKSEPIPEDNDGPVKVRSLSVAAPDYCSLLLDSLPSLPRLCLIRLSWAGTLKRLSMTRRRMC